MATILLIEDDLPLLRLYEGSLSAEHSVIPVETAKGAMRAIDQHHPDLIILDLNLPDAPGTAILNYLNNHEAFRHIQVIVLMGFNRPQTLTGNIAGTLSKPVTASTLLKQVNQCLVNKVF